MFASRRLAFVFTSTYLRRCGSSSEVFRYNPKIPLEDQQKILDLINRSTLEELARYDMTQSRLKKIDRYKSKVGPFKSLSDILEVEGLGVQILDKLCQSIIKDQTSEAQPEDQNERKTKNKRTLLVPPLASHDLTSAVGLHLEPGGISWAQMTLADNKIIKWNIYDFSSLPKKLLPTETYTLAASILKQLPRSDVYIFEMTPTITAPKATVAITYNQQMELMAMLLALINSQHENISNEKISIEGISNEDNHNEGKSYFGMQTRNRVYFLKPKIPARMFRTLVGREKVATNDAVSSLLQPNSDSELPCGTIEVDLALKEMYWRDSPAHKDLLGQSLLLVIAFMELCVYKNPVSLKAISRKSSKE